MAGRSACASGKGWCGMGADEVRIDQLTLRIPGLSAEEGREIGEAVCRKVADSLPPIDRPVHLDRLHLRLEIPAGTTRSRLSGLIAAAIAERLR